MKKQINMTEGPLIRNMISFTVPVMLASLIQVVFNSLDLFFAGQFCGVDGTAIIGSTTAITALLTNFFIGLGVGVNVAVAHAIGSKNEVVVSRAVHTAIPLALTGGLLLLIIGFFVSEPMLKLLGTDVTIINGAAEYMKLYFVGCIPMLVYNFAAGIFRANGDSETPMKLIIVAGFVNICLKPIFILGLKMGVAGVAVSTALAHLAAAILSLRMLMKRNDACRFEIKKMRFHRKELGRLLALGIPSAFQSAMFAISNVCIQSAINGFGKAFVSGNAAANNTEVAVYAVINSSVQTTINFTGQNVGSGNIDRVKKIFKSAVFGTAIFGTAVCAVVYLLRMPLINIYTTDPDAVAGGMYRMMFVCVPYVIYSVTDVIAGAVRGLGASLTPTIMSFLGICVFRVAWQYTVFPIYGTKTSLFIAYPISWILAGLGNLVCYFIFFNKLKNKLQKSR